MLPWLIEGMVFSGAALMIYNIVCFTRFARAVKSRKSWKGSSFILDFPIILLVFFFIGYAVVGVFGNPDLVMAGILFFGSIFVFVMYKLLSKVVRKVTEGEHLEAELMAAEESNRAKNSFLSSISHEMRTPLNVIIGLDTIALTDKRLPEQTRTYLKKIGLSANHLLGLINNVLDLNGIESGDLQLKQEDFRLKDALEQVNAIVQTLCERKGLRYCASFEDCGALCCTGDEMMLKKVLLALLDNAVKYTDAPGEVTLTVRCESREDGCGRFRFAVKDTGVGMEQSFIDRAFDFFTREDASSTSRHGGSGLGLAVTREIVALMGGEIQVESTKNVGSVFTVLLPLAVSEEKQQAAPSAQALDSLERRRVLIVEDIPENAEIAADLLELEGVETEHAENGQVGLDMFEASPLGYYDAILMDLRMPVMDGLESARHIRALDRADAKTVPIIALTANAFESDIRETMQVGMNAHLAKPADSDTLYQTLKEQIGQRPDLERRNMS